MPYGSAQEMRFVLNYENFLIEVRLEEVRLSLVEFNVKRAEITFQLDCGYP